MSIHLYITNDILDKIHIVWFRERFVIYLTSLSYIFCLAYSKPLLWHGGLILKIISLTNNFSTILFRKRTVDTSHWTLSTDVPIVVLKLGSKLNPEDIEEGDDVYFECVVQANPPAYKVIWEHNVSEVFIVFSTDFKKGGHSQFDWSAA